MTETFPADPVSVKIATSDLPKRAASAVVMLAVAGAALWIGGVTLRVFIALVALACFVEFVLLVLRATDNAASRLAAIVAGAAYIGIAGAGLASLDVLGIVAVVGAVICVDTFAYFFGRAIGGPKIAPRISPSKTWAGLLGGVVGASLWIGAYSSTISIALNRSPFALSYLPTLIAGGAVVAVAAQSGDFFESWLKRRAGVKDSSKLIPGHGGVFDRVDGILPVALLMGAASAFA